MSPALSDLPIRKITRVLESLDFVYVRTKGSHAGGQQLFDSTGCAAWANSPFATHSPLAYAS